MTEERLRERLHDVAGTAAESHDDYDRLWEQGVAKRRRHTMTAVLGSLAVSGVVVAAALAGIAPNESGATDEGAPTASQPSRTPWEQLTGRAVGEALGLTPIDIAVADNYPVCSDHYTQYDGRFGFCYHVADLGITSDVEAELLALQIVGYERTDALVDYAHVTLRINDLGKRVGEIGNEPDPTLVPRLMALVDQRDELRHQLVKHDSLTDHEYSVAVDVAKQETDRFVTTLGSAWATVSQGTVEDSNIGQPCTSGTLLHITLTGTFHGIAVSPAPALPSGPPPDTTVSAIRITADPESGQPCLLSVQTGEFTPEPDATSLFIG